MALLCVGSVRGAPGATTLGLLMAGCWPRPAALVEADPAGGVLAARYGLGRSPGLAELAAAAQSHAPDAALWQAAQELPGGLGVVVAPESGEVTTGVLLDAAAALGTWCGQLDGSDVVADCGRLTTDTPTGPLLEAADAVLVAARPVAEELLPAAHRLHASGRRRRAAPLGLVLVGERPYGARDVEERLGVRVAGTLASDAKTAGMLRDGGSPHALRRSPLVRSVRSLVDAVCDRLGIAPPPPVSGGDTADDAAVGAATMREARGMAR